MLIQMLETRQGSEDGKRVQRYERGCVYDLDGNLPHAFLAAGFAVQVYHPDDPRRPPPRTLRLVKRLMVDG